MAIWLRALRSPTKKLPMKGRFFIGDPTAINLKLFLAPDYYQATMERYKEIRKFYKAINLV